MCPVAVIVLRHSGSVVAEHAGGVAMRRVAIFATLLLTPPQTPFQFAELQMATIRSVKVMAADQPRG